MDQDGQNYVKSLFSTKSLLFFNEHLAVGRWEEVLTLKRLIAL